MIIYAYVDRYNRIHVDPTVTINSNNEGAYKVQFIFQDSWDKELNLFGVFKPANDIPISYKLDENMQVDLPRLKYGRYRKLGIGLKGMAIVDDETTTLTTSKSFNKSDFIKRNDSEYVCVIDKDSLNLKEAQLLNICVFTDQQQTILEPIDYFVQYTPTQIIITLNIDLESYIEYIGKFNFIGISGGDKVIRQKQIIVSTDYYYIPVELGAV